MRSWHITRDDEGVRARAFCEALMKRFTDRPVLSNSKLPNVVVAFDPVDGTLELGPGLRVVVANSLVAEHMDLTLDGVEIYLRDELERRGVVQ